MVSFWHNPAVASSADCRFTPTTDTRRDLRAWAITFAASMVTRTVPGRDAIVRTRANIDGHGAHAVKGPQHER